VPLLSWYAADETTMKLLCTDFCSLFVAASMVFYLRRIALFYQYLLIAGMMHRSVLFILVLFINNVSNVHIFQYLFSELLYDWVEVPRDFFSWTHKGVVYHYIKKEKGEETHTTHTLALLPVNTKTWPRPVGT
jgi:hypothetical protein